MRKCSSYGNSGEWPRRRVQYLWNGRCLRMTRLLHTRRDNCRPPQIGGLPGLYTLPPNPDGLNQGRYSRGTYQQHIASIFSRHSLVTSSRPQFGTRIRITAAREEVSEGGTASARSFDRGREDHTRGSNREDQCVRLERFKIHLEDNDVDLGTTPQRRIVHLEAI